MIITILTLIFVTYSTCIAKHNLEQILESSEEYDGSADGQEEEGLLDKHSEN